MEIAIIDEQPGKALLPVGPVRFNRPKITVRDLIAARVALEIESATDRCVFAGVGTDALAEQLNRPARDTRDTRIERTVADAEAAFARGRYFLLAGDRQLESLDEEIEVATTSEVIFLLLMPLKGG